MTPTKEEVYAESMRLWKNDLYKHGYDELGQNNPTEQELKESGFWSVAISQLMRDRPKTESAEWNDYNENLENSDDLKFDFEETMKSGVLVSGTTGTGKSDLGMYLADRLMKEGIIIVVFDSSQDWQKTIKHSAI